MDVAFAFICDYAENSSKLTAVGIGFDTIYAQEVPLSHPTFFVVAAFRFKAVEAGSKTVEVHIVDADGGDVVPALRTQVEIVRPQPGYTHRTHRIALGLHGVTFPAYGDYEVSWLIDSHESAVIPLKIAPPPKQPS